MLSAGVAIIAPNGYPLTACRIQYVGTDHNPFGQIGPQQPDWPERAASMATMISIILESNMESGTYADAIIEIPSNWFCERGQSSKDSEAVQKLYFTVGASVLALAHTTGIMCVWGVHPEQWKGQTPKNIMLNRAEKLAGIRINNHDAAEAILLGAYAHARQHPIPSDPAIEWVRFQKPIAHVHQGCCTPAIGAQRASLLQMPYAGQFTIINYIG
jgi:hypothetical protein